MQDGMMPEHEFNIEKALYFERCTELMREFRRHKKIDETDSFLKSLVKGDN